MPRKHEIEADLEARCVARIDALGGMALKLSIPGARGFPDRTILMPGANVWYAEFKRLRTGAISAQQHRWRVLLTQLGFGVYFVDSDVTFEAALEKELGC